MGERVSGLGEGVRRGRWLLCRVALRAIPVCQGEVRQPVCPVV